MCWCQNTSTWIFEIFGGFRNTKMTANDTRILSPDWCAATILLKAFSASVSSLANPIYAPVSMHDGYTTSLKVLMSSN